MARTRQDGQGINYDFDRSCRTPTAWRDLKRAAERIGGRLPMLLKLLEEKGGSPRLSLTVAVANLVNADPEKAAQMHIAYFDWEQSQRKREEQAKINAEFEQVMGRLFGPDWKNGEPPAGMPGGNGNKD